MARRIRYYHVLKQIHLISSIVLLTVVFIFLITGIVVVNRPLFENPETIQTQQKVPVEKPMTGSPEKYSNFLKETQGFQGREFQRQEKNGNWIFTYNFQGKNQQVTLTPEQDTLYIQTSIQEMNLLSFSTKLHHMRGFKGGWEYTVWAVFYDLTAVSFVIFAVTGFLMWLKVRKRYTKGWWFLTSGFIIPLIIIALFYIWR